jgi:hypothetical protein
MSDPTAEAIRQMEEAAIQVLAKDMAEGKPVTLTADQARVLGQRMLDLQACLDSARKSLELPLAIAREYDRRRGVGHTDALIRGCDDRSTFIAHNANDAADARAKLGQRQCRARVRTVADLSRPLPGSGPLVVDHFVWVRAVFGLAATVSVQDRELYRGVTAVIEKMRSVSAFPEKPHAAARLMGHRIPKRI